MVQVLKNHINKDNEPLRNRTYKFVFLLASIF